jgi:hypothetical protein
VPQLSRHIRLGAAFPLASLLGACRSSVPAVPLAGQSAVSQRVPAGSLRDAVITLDASSKALEYWPIGPHGARRPQPLTDALGGNPAFVAAAFGHTVVLASQRPPSLVLFDLVSKRERVLADPDGTPLDVAVDRGRNLYALNLEGNAGTVTFYPATSRRPRRLACSNIGVGEAIAVDNEGDAFVNGYPPHAPAGVIEIPRASQSQGCVRLSLRPEPGYVAGIAVDPKTDDLIVFDDPDDCAGGLEGRMTIYSAPYDPRTATVRELGANCAGGLRLNAAGTLVFFADETVSGGSGFIAQRTYPGGRGTASYRGGNFRGFTTFPNALPN